ncbi:MAG TPA: hypothetical protein VNF74_11805 [Terriglobales bacterium]|nr:hypothetical protein [Terriglobales bacterium]
MKCRQAVRAMTLLGEGEADAELERHCRECPECAQQAGLTRGLASLMSRAREGQATDEERLPAQRAALLARLARLAPVRPPIMMGWGTVPQKMPQMGVATAALLLCGFAGGWAARARLRPPAAGGSGTNDATRVAQYQVEGIEAGAAGVAIRYRVVRQGRLQGRLSDGDVQRLLLEAVEHPVNAGVRMDAMRLLGQAGPTPAVEAALVAALREDPNPGVRLRALAALTPMVTAERTRLLGALALAAAEDGNAGVRTQAIQALGQTAAAAPLLRAIGDGTADTTERLSCAAALQRLGATVPPQWLSAGLETQR